MLVEAVESVLAQSYRPLEFLIVDDGLADDTPAVADAAGCRTRRSARPPHPERGRHCPEAGRRQVRGEFVQYLDSDDVLLPGKFESQVRALGAYPSRRVLRDDALHRRGRRRGQSAPGDARESGSRACSLRSWSTVGGARRRRSIAAALRTRQVPGRRSGTRRTGIRLPRGALGLPLAYVPEFVSEQRGHAADRLSRGGSNDPAKLRTGRRPTG